MNFSAILQNCTALGAPQVAVAARRLLLLMARAKVIANRLSGEAREMHSAGGAICHCVCHLSATARAHTHTPPVCTFQGNRFAKFERQPPACHSADALKYS